MFISPCLIALWVVGFADKQPIPTPSEQDQTRTRLKAAFKVEYARTDQTAAAKLSAILMERASEEKENHAGRYVMYSEAMTFAIKAGKLDIAVRAARQIDQEFVAPDLK